MSENKEEQSVLPESATAETYASPKKKLGFFLLEFFMIFLAVFLGSIAENIREDYGERQQAKEYAQALYNDLKKDSIDLDFFVSLKRWRNAKLDSLIILLEVNDHQKIARELYHYHCYSTMTDLNFKPSDITIQQLRNTGSLRYFNIPLYKLVNQYYNDCSFYTERENDNKQFTPSLSLISKIFNADLLVLMYGNTYQQDIRNVIRWPSKKAEFKLLPNYEQSWNEYSMFVRRQRQRFALPVELLNRGVRDNLSKLMAALRKEYEVR